MPDKRPRSKIHAPYNFVPVSGHVHEVDWGASCDLPFRDGISGYLVVELEVVTPLCVGGAAGGKNDRRQETREVEPFRTFDQELAIPGTSIKGMLRNVVEIATFSKLQLVDRDRRYAVRDLSNPRLYRNRMAGSTPGWLVADGDQWYVRPCKMARVEQQELIRYLQAKRGKDAAEGMKKCFTNRRPVNLREKYDAWGGDGDSLFLPFEPRSQADRFSDADLSRQAVSGQLVLTGQPSANLRLLPGKGRRGRFKHREFIFYGEPGPKKKIDEQVKRNFELNHSQQQGQKHSGLAEPNDEWGYWRARMLKGKRVPVFFIEENGEVTSIGLTQMYRLAYKLSVGEAIENVSIDHHPDPGGYLARRARDKDEVDRLRSIRPKTDFAETLFGYVRGHQGGDAARGRVDVGLFDIESGGNLTEMQTAVLSAPKPTYYPSYVDQTPNLDESGVQLRRGADYLTFMDERCEPRGWKRYPARREAASPPPPPTASENVATSWTAVADGIFGGRIRFHNVRPVELGAVLWAIDFGGRHHLCHTLGYAKPFGYGNVKLHVRTNRLRKLVDGADVDLGAAREEFESHMEKAVPRWEKTEQIVQLLAMADPNNETRLDYMVLDHTRKRNDFLAAKGPRRDEPRYVLPSYVEYGGKRDRDRFPRTDREKAWEKRLADAGPQAGKRDH